MTLHFAYGSNMSRALMRPRCPGARELGLAVLADHRFVITSDGYASVLPSRGELVHGLLWRLAPRDLAALDAYEDVASGLYRAVTLPVRTGERRVSALVYVARSRACGRPKPGYLDIVLAAARELALPPDYVESLAQWAPAGARQRRVCQSGESA
jgi:gamma-glutamylcyclotransferase (GGCT)/AIG2-like uncharacterized protein YtfP